MDFGFFEDLWRHDLSHLHWTVVFLEIDSSAWAERCIPLEEILSVGKVFSEPINRALIGGKLYVIQKSVNVVLKEPRSGRHSRARCYTKNGRHKLTFRDEGSGLPDIANDIQIVEAGSSFHLESLVNIFHIGVLFAECQRKIFCYAA